MIIFKTFLSRNEDEVDEAEILVKVSKATASSFNFKVCIDVSKRQSGIIHK